MRKLLSTISFIFLFSAIFAQSQLLLPAANFTNETNDTLFILPSKQVKALLSDAVSNDINLEKLKLYQQKVILNEERIALADSAIQMKKLEAEFWHQQLLSNDQSLENQRIENMKLIDDKNRIRKSRIYYLVAGFVAGAFVISQ